VDETNAFGQTLNLSSPNVCLGDAVVLELLEAKGLVPRDLAAGIDIVAFALATGDAAADAASACALAGVARELRAIGATVDLVLEPKKPKWAFKHADRRSARACVMLAPDEWATALLLNSAAGQ